MGPPRQEQGEMDDFRNVRLREKAEIRRPLPEMLRLDR